MNQREQIVTKWHSKLEMQFGYLPNVPIPKPGVRSPETEQRGSKRGKDTGQNGQRLFSFGLAGGSMLKTRSPISEGPGIYPLE